MIILFCLFYLFCQWFEHKLVNSEFFEFLAFQYACIESQEALREFKKDEDFCFDLACQLLIMGVIEHIEISKGFKND